MAGLRFSHGARLGHGGDQHSASGHIDQVHAIARATGYRLVGLGLLGGLEPMVDAEAGGRTSIHDGDHAPSVGHA